MLGIFCAFVRLGSNNVKYLETVGPSRLLRIFGYIFLPFAVGLVGLVMLMSLVTALAYAWLIVAGCFFAMRFYERHHRFDVDERLPFERIQRAIDWYVQEVKEN